MSGSVSYELFKKINLLQAASFVSQIVATGSAIPFITNMVLQGDAITHIPGSTDFNLVEEGLYKVTFISSVGVNNEALLTVGVGISVNGTMSASTIVNETLPSVLSVSCLSTQQIVEVLPNNSVLVKIVNSKNADMIYTSPNIIIQKIG